MINKAAEPDSLLQDVKKQSDMSGHYDSYSEEEPTDNDYTERNALGSMSFKI